MVPVLTQTSTFNFESKFAVLTICSDNLKRNASNNPSGSANSCNRRAGARQDRHAGSRQQTRSWDGLLRSQEPRDRAEEAAARQQQAETPQHKAQCAGPAVQVDAKAASKTAASVIARLNVSLAPPPRRSMCHTLANETPFHCKTTATASDDFSLDLPDRSDCLELTALQPILQMFTLGPLSRAGNVLTVPYPQKCSDSVLTAF